MQCSTVFLCFALYIVIFLHPHPFSAHCTLVVCRKLFCIQLSTYSQLYLWYSSMSVNLTSNFFRLICHFRRQDLVSHDFDCFYEIFLICLLRNVYFLLVFELVKNLQGNSTSLQIGYIIFCDDVMFRMNFFFFLHKLKG